MIATSFIQQTNILQLPEGEIESVLPLPVAVRRTNENIQLISCWSVSGEELKEINRTRKVWLSIFGGGCPPLLISGLNPFEDYNPGVYPSRAKALELYRAVAYDLSEEAFEEVLTFFQYSKHPSTEEEKEICKIMAEAFEEGKAIFDDI